jgi:predicted short-subunit dehydrogenase-like oxidoreductase (DUF2520 family)
VLSLVERKPERLQFLRERLNWSFLEENLSVEKLQQSDVVLLLVQDDHLPELVNHLATLPVQWTKKIVGHLSGVLPSTVMEPLRKKGARIAAVHAVFAFAEDPRENHYLNKIWFNMEGDSEALDFFEELLSHTGNPTKRVTIEQKEAIHIASVIYANFYISLAEMSRKILQQQGFPENEIFDMLSPLLTSSVEQVLKHGTTGALTGPIKRGDVDTLSAHLKYLREHHPELVEVYKMLSRFLIPISGLSESERKELEDILK